MIETVRDLIKELMDYNLDANVFIGDNFNNHVTLSYGGADGCDKRNCSDVGFQIEGEGNSEQESEPAIEMSGLDLTDAEYLYKETIVITDPCYLKGLQPLIRTSTIYGDWSCMVYPGKMKDNKDPEKWNKEYNKFYNDYNFGYHTTVEKDKMREDWKWFKRRWKEERTLGEFCADAGEVGVFEWDRLSEEQRQWVREHDLCAAVINDVIGWVGFKTVTDEEGNRSRHVVCEGKTNFFTMQSGF